MEIRYTKSSPLPRLWGIYWASAWPALRFKRLFRALAGLETTLLAGRVPEVTDPIFVCGLARSGTTVTLELLGSHPDTASFRYGDMAQPFLTFTWNVLAGRRFAGAAPPQERPHGDGLVMAPDRPEAVEELYWQQGFAPAHDETRSGVLDSSAFDAAFNRFYLGQIGKLLLAREKPRYLAKANYHVTRLSYLTRLFRSPRILILVRHPVAHAVSYLKQQQRLSELYRKDRRWWEIARHLGHYEFGEQMQFINTGDNQTVRKIRNLWENGRGLKALAVYWDMVYRYLLRTVSGTPALSAACLFVRYEDLCRDTELWLDRILDHCGLPRSGFGPARQARCNALSLPGYYRASLTRAERESVWAVTRETAGRFGYGNVYHEGSL